MSESRAPRGLLLVLCATGIVVTIMHTLIVPLVPVLPEILHSNPTDAYWALTSTLLAAAILTPIAGRLGDMFGKKLILIGCLTSLAIGSVICAFADTVPVMVTGRALQGAASGAIALGISILRDELPPQKVGPAVALMSSSMGLGGAFGMPIAAAVADRFDWHVLFWGSAALSVLCLALVVFLVPESPVRTPGRFDVVGSLGLVVGLTATMLTITRGQEWGWASVEVLGLVGVAVVVFPLWGWHQMRVREPLVDLRVSAHPQVLFTNLASIGVGFALYGTSLLFTQILMSPEASGYGLGLDMVEAGLVLAPGGFAMFFAARAAAKVTERHGARISLLGGIVVIAAGYLLGVIAHDQLWQVITINILVSIGIGIAFAAMPALIMGAVPITETAAANGLNALMRSLGTTSSSAVFSAVLAGSTILVAGHAMPSGEAIETSLIIGLCAALVALVFGFLLPKASAPIGEHGHGGVVPAEAGDRAAATRA
ncbi:MFS transporter [Nocardioides dubius]|uniref:MFS transporter n=1 Tax=Nocardioides dubius TaxID=317019 RepID=A0ABP4EK68_9ACTN